MPHSNPPSEHSASSWRRFTERYEVRIRRFVEWLRARLWVRPVIYSLGALAAAVAARSADLVPLPERAVPDVPAELITTLMSVLTASMLGVATFAVASMVAAYQSVGSNATPRAFSLIVADDMSKRALSTFVGAFIFGTIGLIALELSLYDVQGRFAFFGTTLAIYAWVIWTFISWIDAIARLGRLETAITRVERACSSALDEAAKRPHRGGRPPEDATTLPHRYLCEEIGYVTDIDVRRLQEVAEHNDATVLVVATPGHFVGRGTVLAQSDRPLEADQVTPAFLVGRQRSFAGDPRFGLVVLSQIASRALSPGVNDPGTAIDVLGAQTRLLADWSQRRREHGAPGESEPSASCPHVQFPALDPATLVEDAFSGIARDGSRQVEVMVRLQRVLAILAQCDDHPLKQAVADFSATSWSRSRAHLDFDKDRERVQEAAQAVEKTLTAASHARSR